MARRADAFAFSLLEIAREVASFVHGDFAAGRGDFADIVALFDTSVLCRAAVTEAMGAELENVSLRVYMVRLEAWRRLIPTGRPRPRRDPLRHGPASSAV